MSEERFNPEMLILARELRGIRQAVLANYLNISQGELSRYEGGLTSPSDATLQAIANALGFPVSHFTRSGERYGPEPWHYLHIRPGK